MHIRTATIADLPTIYQIETACFAPNEAASEASFAKRLNSFPEHFWLLETNGRLAGFVNGMVSDHQTIVDEMFTDATLHNKKAGWQSIFGLAVAPEFRQHGFASKLMDHLIQQSREQGRIGVTLTCKAKLIPYYQKFGFTDLGVSASVHGGEVWHDMTLTF